jgi:hypothetical protein
VRGGGSDGGDRGGVAGGGDGGGGDGAGTASDVTAASLLSMVTPNALERSVAVVLATWVAAARAAVRFDMSIRAVTFTLAGVTVSAMFRTSTPASSATMRSLKAC